MLELIVIMGLTAFVLILAELAKTVALRALGISRR